MSSSGNTIGTPANSKPTRDRSKSRKRSKETDDSNNRGSDPNHKRSRRVTSSEISSIDSRSVNEEKVEHANGNNANINLKTLDEEKSNGSTSERNTRSKNGIRKESKRVCLLFVVIFFQTNLNFLSPL